MLHPCRRLQRNRQRRLGGGYHKGVYVFHQLTPDTEYEVKIRARNRYGWSNEEGTFLFRTSYTGKSGHCGHQQDLKYVIACFSNYVTSYGWTIDSLLKKTLYQFQKVLNNKKVFRTFKLAGDYNNFAVGSLLDLEGLKGGWLGFGFIEVVSNQKLSCFYNALFAKLLSKKKLGATVEAAGF